MFFVAPLSAAPIRWNNSLTGDWTVSTNWLPAQVPGASDTVEINDAGTSKLQAATATIQRFTLGQSTADSGTLQILGGGARLTVSDASVASVVGNQGTGVLNVTGGGKLATQSVDIAANHASAQGSVSISGGGSRWDVWDLRVGVQGAGTLSITNGGKVIALEATTDSFPQTWLGYDGGSTGTATVSGAGSRWENYSMYVGYQGAGSLRIQNGGTMSTTTFVHLGQQSGSTGAAVISGAGSHLNVGDLIVGYSGNATLDITNGGRVSTTYKGSSIFWVGGTASSTSVANVSGGGSVLDMGFVSIGNGGNGTLNIKDGGKVIGQRFYIGSNLGSVGTTNISGAGSQLLADDLTVSWLGKGVLNIEDKATVTVVQPGSYFSITLNGGTQGVVNIRNATLIAPQISAGYGDAILNIKGSNATIITEKLNEYAPFVAPRERVLNANFYLDGNGASTINATSSALMYDATYGTGVKMTILTDKGFQALRTDHLDLVSAATMTGEPMTVANQTVFQYLSQSKERQSGRDIVRMQFNDGEIPYNWDLLLEYRFKDGNDQEIGLVKGTMKVDGEYTYLAAIFEGLDSLSMAETLADHLNSRMNTGQVFSVLNPNALLLTGGYLGAEGYGYFGWDLTEFNGLHNASVSLLGFNEVPEPATWTMMLLGLAGWVGVSRARNRIGKLA